MKNWDQRSPVFARGFFAREPAAVRPVAERGIVIMSLYLYDDRFKCQIAKMAGRRADKLPMGRPPAKRSDKRQIILL